MQEVVSYNCPNCSTLLSYTSRYCPHCNEEIEFIDSYYKRYGAINLFFMAFILISFSFLYYYFAENSVTMYVIVGYLMLSGIIILIISSSILSKVKLIDSELKNQIEESEYQKLKNGLTIFLFIFYLAYFLIHLFYSIKNVNDFEYTKLLFSRDFLIITGIWILLVIGAQNIQKIVFTIKKLVPKISIKPAQKFSFKMISLTAFSFILIFFILGKVFNDDKNNAVLNEHNSVNPIEKEEIESWLSRGDWTCTDVLEGTAPFMRGAMFSFNNGRLVVAGGGTRVANNYVITGILKNVPKNTKYSALVKINNNDDMLTWIDENLMVLSWGGDKAKLQLQRR